VSSSDKLIIETPEQTSLEFPLAGVGSRFLAVALDTLLQFGVYAVLGILAIIAVSAGFTSGLQKQWTIAILVFAGFSVQLGYFALFESLWNGQTPGKRWTHLRVIQDSGRPITPYDAILRNLLRIVDSLPSMYAVGLVTMLISRENKRLGDYAAGTVVIHEKPLQGVDSIWNAPAAGLAQPIPFVLSTQLTADELQLAESFLERRMSLSPEVRGSMARQIAERLGQRLNVPREARPDAEKFLEIVAEQKRNAARFH